MKLVAGLFVLLAAIASPLRAQDISGAWQATVGDAQEHHRLILQIYKASDDGWKATFYLIDDSPDGFALTSFTQNGPEIAFAVPNVKIDYKGRISPDGKSIAGKMIWDGKGSVTFIRATPETAWPHDIHCSCSVSFMRVERGVNLEILDWGGSGRPVILLAGLGGTAHDFDTFAHKLTAKYRVYGITRRGYGESSSPPPIEANYNADRLGDDVVAVISQLHLQQRPVLVGHSIAGEELSSVGSRHPEKVAALIYLDAAYGYAFYNPAHPDFDLDALSLREQLGNLLTGSDKEKAISQFLADLPGFEARLREQMKQWAGVPGSPQDSSDESAQDDSILLGERKYTKIKVPVLAIYASPHKLEPMPDYDAAARATMARNLQAHTTAAITALKTGMPSACLVLIPNADHLIYQSNEAEVLQAIHGFLGTVPERAVLSTQSVKVGASK